MCHESSGVALDADHRHRQGQRHPRRHPRGRADPGRRPEPRHQPPPDAERAGAGQAARRRPSWPSTRMPEAGLIRFKNPQHARGVIGKGTELADEYLQVKLAADLALFQLLNRRLVELDDERGDVLDRGVPRRALRRGRRARWPTCGRSTPTRCWPQPVSRRDEVERVAQLLATRSRIVICWAMGITQHRQAVPTIREMVNTLLLRGSIGKPGRGRVPGPWPLQRAGRPDDGHLREAVAERSSMRSAPSSGSSRRREHGYDTVDAIGAMARGRRRRVRGHGRQLPGRRPRHRCHRRCARPHQAHACR